LSNCSAIIMHPGGKTHKNKIKSVVNSIIGNWIKKVLGGLRPPKTLFPMY
jgi:hypothetical protein